MKAVNFKTVFISALILFGLGCAAMVTAQTEAEQNIKKLKKNLELAKFKNENTYNDVIRESDVGQDPCTMYDDEEWYTAFNQKEGRRGDSKLAISLLQQCKQLLSQKIRGAYKSVTRDYFDQIDINDKSEAAAHIESAGEMVVEKILNDVLTYCQKTSNPDERGNIIMYMGIRVSKKEIVDKVANELSQDKQAGVRFNEAKFRESAFKVFDKEEY